MQQEIAGLAFRIAETPEELVKAAPGPWHLMEYLPADNIEAFTAIWDRTIGLVFDDGAVALEELGDGVWRLTSNTRLDSRNPWVPLGTAMAYAFAATDCTRIVTHCYGRALLDGLDEIGLRPYARREMPGTDGAKLERFDLGAALDEWLHAFGPRAFYAEAQRLGNGDKGYRALCRWALYYGDESVLSPEPLASTDTDKLLTDSRVTAAEAGFSMAEGTVQWLTHHSACGWEHGPCTCSPIVGFSNGAEVAQVDADGNIERAKIQ